MSTSKQVESMVCKTLCSKLCIHFDKFIQIYAAKNRAARPRQIDVCLFYFSKFVYDYMLKLMDLPRRLVNL